MVFGGGWPPSELDRMSVAELLRWHATAIERDRLASAR
ncbi:MAG: GpE family phage tail protein [Cardiobacterium sp.]